MYGFGDTDVVGRALNTLIWRRDSTMLIQVIGLLDDAVSEGWRGLATADFERQGYPRFIAVDFAHSDPQNSMMTRYRSASFVRETMKRVEYAAVLSGSSAGPTVVIRAVLRTLGLPNLVMLSDADEFTQSVASMLRGVRPTRGALSKSTG